MEEGKLTKTARKPLRVVPGAKTDPRPQKHEIEERESAKKKNMIFRKDRMKMEWRRVQNAAFTKQVQTAAARQESKRDSRKLVADATAPMKENELIYTYQVDTESQKTAESIKDSNTSHGVSEISSDAASANIDLVSSAAPGEAFVVKSEISGKWVEDGYTVGDITAVSSPLELHASRKEKNKQWMSQKPSFDEDVHPEGSRGSGIEEQDLEHEDYEGHKLERRGSLESVIHQGGLREEKTPSGNQDAKKEYPFDASKDIAEHSAKTVGSTKVVSAIHLNVERSESDVLVKSKSTTNKSDATLSDFGVINLSRIAQQVVQRADEMYRIMKAECLQIDSHEACNKEEVEETSEDKPKPKNVKVVLEGDVEKTFFLDSNLNVAEAKELMAQQFSTISKNIVFSRNGRILSKAELLETADITMELRFDEVTESLDVESPQEQPDIVQVKILQDDGTCKYAKVAVVHSGAGKQYMGGYRDKRTGQLYYHVICQTDHRRRGREHTLTTREVQTNLPTVDCGVNTARIAITQTSDMPSDVKVMAARPYVPYNETHKTMVPHRAAQIIQKSWRRHMFHRMIVKHFKALAASLEEKATEDTKAWKMVEKRRMANMIAKAFPSYRPHFSDILAVVDWWARSAAGRLASTKTGFARKAAMYKLLQDEQEMLYRLETQRLKAVEENLQRQGIMFLEGTARSRARLYPKGNVTLVDDLNIQKAGVFKEMFASYCRTDTTTTERLEILSCMRHSLLQEFGLNNPEVNDLVEIVDRETDLINIGFPKSQMVYLHKRFESRFLQLTRNPEVNPQAKYFRPSHVKQKKYAIRRCLLCNKNLPSSLMLSKISIKKFRICKSCAQLEVNVATHQLNFAPYKRMLISMRTRELEKNCRSAIPFLVQPLATYFLVNVIWNGKSVLSGNSDLTQLGMTRWLPDQDWSVWNNILLTEKEVVEHERIPDPMKHYSEELILQVRTRNIFGRMNFAYLVDIDNDFKFNRPHVGTLPRDYLLYTNKHHQKFAPHSEVPEFFKPK